MIKSFNGQRCVFVLSKDRKPLMPSTRFGKVKRLLRSGKAKPVCNLPFTIQLTYDLTTEMFQELAIGIDPGRTNIGVSVVREDGKCLYQAHLTTRNKQIPKLMEKRKEHRHASRRGERLRRKRRAKKNNTIMKNGFVDRILPGCSKPVRVKDIKNTEAKFINRRVPKGWLTPTARHLLLTHINLVKKIQRILPITKVCVEVNKFIFMMLDNPGIRKWDIDFKHGPLYGYENVTDYINKIQSGRCLLCNKNPIEHVHHVLTKKQNGSNTIDNLVGLCSYCHTQVHTDIIAKEKLDSLHTKRNKKYGALSVVNQIMPFLINEFKKLLPSNCVYLTNGYKTKYIRDVFNIYKNHELDAYCIAVQAFNLNEIKIDCDTLKVYEILQFRRQNRAHIHRVTERIYKLDNKIVAKNRKKRVDQFEDSLYDAYSKWVTLYGEEEATKMRSRLKVTKGKICHYSDMKREMPGAIFKYNDQYYILRGQKDKGYYYLAHGHGLKQFLAKKCQIIAHNRGLVLI